MKFLSKLFKRDPPKEETRQIITVKAGGFSTFTGSAYDNDIFRAGVDAIARNAAKLKPVHCVNYGGQKQPSTDKRLQKLLQVSPNEYMSAYDFQYKLITQLFLQNNAFTLIERQGNKVVGLYPLTYTHAEFQMSTEGEMYVELTFTNGKKAQFRYADVIHLRRHFNSNELFGEDNSAISAGLQLAHAQNQSIVNNLKTAASLRGILKFTQNLAKSKLLELKNQFVNEFLSLTNDGGVAAVDPLMEFQPITSAPVNLDATALTATRDKIFSYLGVTEKIVNSAYTEDEFAAFYESVIEPVAVQMSLEFTRKIFNERERAFGNSIVFESGRLQFTANKTKVNLIRELLPLGLLTINQALEILNLAPVEGGDRRLQTLNVVDAALANDYQLSKAGGTYGKTAGAIGNESANET